MQLNATIARQIVERAKQIIRYSVNVMDEHGRIIGSTDPNRLNQRHEGAVLALDDNRVVEIDTVMSGQLKGVKPGINLPIVFQDQTIGVVGISGEPEQVRSYGELVKMAAELIVEHQALMSKLQWNKRHREELVLQLIQGNDLSENQRLAIAERLALDLSQPRVAAIVQAFPTQGESLSAEHLQRLVQLLEQPEHNNLVGISSVSMNEVVVLLPISLDADSWSKPLAQKQINKLLKSLAKENGFTTQMALGGYFSGLEGWPKSYLTAKATIESHSRSPGGKNTVVFYQDHILPVLLGSIQDDSWRYEQLRHPLLELQKSDPRGILLKTLKAYFDHNCDLAQTCESLHIHRNTLRYRLDKIEQVTSLRFSDISEKTRLYLAVISRNQ
ncbi:sugar diacid recognition domain-containing protein [Photobacterium kasasachensis]|uniref:sugar diacid recognition domain-containing protein n=1 Tax=Photobacterium kasasachensis TaxID=2910240 RepID=UPI003D12B980